MLADSLRSDIWKFGGPVWRQSSAVSASIISYMPRCISQLHFVIATSSFHPQYTFSYVIYTLGLLNKLKFPSTLQLENNLN